uniref:Amine oxidase domain-containing protein n=1 Tax=Plectus sambesii TaxID=2011161 RepID=A0A914UK73_9BILA
MSNGNKMEHSVAIIGGGFSGLGAAYGLNQGGCSKITLFEASNRLGGRTWTVKTNGHTIELGAQYFHVHKSEIYEFAKKCGAVIQDDARKRYENFESIIVLPDGTRLDQELADSFWDDCYYDNAHKIIMDKDYDQSITTSKVAVLKLFEEWRQRNAEKLASYSSSHIEALESLLRRSVQLQESLGTEDWSNVVLSSYREWLVDSENLNEPTAHGGYGKIVEYVVSQLPANCVKLNHRVSEIDWSSDDGVYLSFEGQEKPQRFDRVVVTCSVGVLKNTLNQMWKPPLPLEKRQLLREITVGQLDRVVAEFPQRFWAKECSNSFEYSVAEKENEPNFFSNIVSVESHPNALLLWVVGHQTLELYQMGQEALSDAIVKFLSLVFPDVDPNKLRPSKIHRSNWGQDRNFLCGYSHQQLVSGAKHVRETAERLAKPLLAKDKKTPLVLFAGEATANEHYATVHSAWNSGRREASRLLADFSSRRRDGQHFIRSAI